MLPDETNQSATVQDCFSAWVPVSTSGTYCTFIQNGSGATVTVKMGVAVFLTGKMIEMDKR